MDEGSALLHHLERRLNHGLTCLVTHSSLTQPHAAPSTQEAVLLVGTEPGLLQQLHQQVCAALAASSHRLPVCPPITVSTHTASSPGAGFPGSGSARHVALVVSATSLASSAQLSFIGRAYRQLALRKANVLLLVHSASPRPAPGGGRAAPDASILAPALLEAAPELRWLAERCRVHTVRGQLAASDGEVLALWLQGQLSHEVDAVAYMDYADLSKIFVRDARQHLPDVAVFLRLLLMCVLGTLAVLATLILLILITKAPEVSRDMAAARSHLATYMERQRTGKAEWGPAPQDALALTALMLHDPSWCFTATDHQRSVDRLEISLLAALSRLSSSPAAGARRDVLTPMQLSLYITALWATYQNPRSFHDHNLLSVLDKYLAQISPYVEFNGFGHSMALIAMCNTGFPIRDRYWERLLQTQKADGSFPLGMDETALVVTALTCARNDSHLGVDAAMKKAATFLAVNRQRDGSYGSVYTTALVLQALSASGAPDDESRRLSMAWLTRQAQASPLVKNLEIAAHVLIALAGKSLLSARAPTAAADAAARPRAELSPAMPRHQAFEPSMRLGRQTGAYKYLSPDPKPGAVNLVQEQEADQVRKPEVDDEDVLIEVDHSVNGKPERDEGVVYGDEGVVSKADVEDNRGDKSKPTEPGGDSSSDTGSDVIDNPPLEAAGRGEESSSSEVPDESLVNDIDEGDGQGVGSDDIDGQKEDGENETTDGVRLEENVRDESLTDSVIEADSDPQVGGSDVNEERESDVEPHGNVLMPANGFSSGRVKSAEKNGKPVIKKGHIDFRQSDRKIDIEDLINDDIDDDDDDVDEPTGFFNFGFLNFLFDNSNDNYEERVPASRTTAETPKIKKILKQRKKKKMQYKRKYCTCRTMNIYDPVYILFNKCPVIPKGCP